MFNANLSKNYDRCFIQYITDKQNIASSIVKFTVGDHLIVHLIRHNDQWVVRINNVYGLTIVTTSTTIGYTKTGPGLGYSSNFKFDHDTGDWIKTNRESYILIDAWIQPLYTYALSNLYVGYTISCIIIKGKKRGEKETFVFRRFAKTLEGMYPNGFYEFISVNSIAKQTKELIRFDAVKCSSFSLRCFEYEWDIREWANMKKNGIYYIMGWLKLTNKLGSFSKDFMKIVKTLL